MSEVRIAAERRVEFGKGAARRTRRAGKVPAVVYGHGHKPVHLALPGHELMLALKTSNALLTIDIDGRDELVLPKAVQRDPIKGFLEHVDLVIVRRGEKVTVEVPVELVGEADADTLVDQQLTSISVQAEATHIPAAVQVSIDGLLVGQHITAGQVGLPANVTLHTEAHHIVVQGLAAPTAAEVEAELEGAEAEAGIEHEEAAEPAEAAAEAGAVTEGEPQEQPATASSES